MSLAVDARNIEHLKIVARACFHASKHLPHACAVLWRAFRGAFHGVCLTLPFHVLLARRVLHGAEPGSSDLHAPAASAPTTQISRIGGASTSTARSRQEEGKRTQRSHGRAARAVSLAAHMHEAVQQCRSFRESK